MDPNQGIDLPLLMLRDNAKIFYFDFYEKRKDRSILEFYTITFA
jgi:hypothetical protein